MIGSEKKNTIANINAIKAKVGIILLINVLLILMILRFFKDRGFGISSDNLLLVLMGGDLGMDAFLRLFFQCLILVLPYFIIRRSIEWWILLLLRLNIILFLIDVFSILKEPFIPFFPDESWLYIRGCAGGGFLSFGFSVLWLIYKGNFGPFKESGIGLFSLSISLYTVVFGIENSPVSWKHFYD
jgi:hypothetical protein